MIALILKEWRENIKWVPLPGLAILVVVLIDRPAAPMLDVTGAFFFCLTGVVFGAALGFLQIFFEGHGERRSLLLHRPLGPSRIFLAKALAGVGLYLLALAIPFVCLESWYATPGKLSAPYHWRTGLPWLADILSGLVYYFAGMLTAQREARWYGSRGLAVAAAFLSSYLVWTVPEFWQALVAIGFFGLFVSVAAWGSFCAGGAYAQQPRVAKAALSMTLLAGFLIISALGKQMIGEWFDSGFSWNYIVDRNGRQAAMPYIDGRGPIGPWIDLQGHALPDLNRSEDADIHAPGAFMEAPLFSSYRNFSRFYVECSNDSKPSEERWFYDQVQGCLVGYDMMLHYYLGSVGPNGFTPAGGQPGEHFQGELRYFNGRWGAGQIQLLAFPRRVYAVNLAQRTIRTLFTPSAGDTVAMARNVGDRSIKWEGVVVTTEKSLQFLTREGRPVVCLPRVHDCYGYLVALLKLQNPERYSAWYRPYPFALFVGPEESRTEPFHLHEYDSGARELAHRSDPQLPYPAASYAKALFGLVTPMGEAATLVGTSRFLRSQGRSQRSIHQTVLLSYLDNIGYFIPGTSRYEETPNGLVPGYIALILFSAAASALGCLLLARRYAFSRARSIGWALAGFCFGWVGFVLMIAIQEWPARIACPKCRKLRIVTRDTCEYCGALNAMPARDGTEIFEPIAATQQAALIEG